MQKIITNKDLSIDFSQWKANITKKRYSYYDFSKEIVSAIANKDDLNISNNEVRALVQALFPQYLQCSGLFDSFLFFNVKDGVRIDPPKYCYCDLNGYLNNDNNAKVNRLRDEIKDLFEQNGIAYSRTWELFFE